MQGWVKLHRKLMQTSFYKDSETVHLAIHLLLKANHSDAKTIFNNKEIIIKRGSLITGRHVLSRETGIHESSIYRKLRILEKVGFSNIESNNKFSVITICHYGSYNDRDNEIEQHLEQPENNQRTYLKNVKNVKKEKKKYFDFVFLTDKELKKLKNQFPSTWEDRIKSLNTYAHKVGIDKFNKQYECHFHMILSFDDYLKGKARANESVKNPKTPDAKPTKKIARNPNTGKTVKRLGDELRASGILPTKKAAEA